MLCIHIGTVRMYVCMYSMYICTYSLCMCVQYIYIYVQMHLRAYMYSGVGSIKKVGRPHYPLRLVPDVVVKPKVFAQEVK